VCVFFLHTQKHPVVRGEALCPTFSLLENRPNVLRETAWDKPLHTPSHRERERCHPRMFVECDASRAAGLGWAGLCS